MSEYFEGGQPRRRAVFDKADIIMTKESNPEVLAICYAQGWCAHENYMTKREARAVKSIPSAVFKDNLAIEHIDELRFFGINKLPASAFINDGKMQHITIPEGITRIEQNALRFYKSGTNNSPRRVILPASVTYIAGYNCYQWGSNTQRVLICLATTPPTCYATNSITNAAQIYVPDVAVDTYKAASIWSTYESRIMPLSQCPAEYLEYHGLLKDQ